MIVKGKKEKKYKLQILALGSLILLVGVLYFLNNRPQQKLTKNAAIFCDAEKVKDNIFLSESLTFKNGNTQSNEKSYSGNFSSKLDKNNKYGISTIINNVKPNTRYLISIRRWTKSPNSFSLVLKSKPQDVLYTQTTTALSIDDNGWGLLQIDYTTPDSIDFSQLSIYTHGKAGVAYFDDLKIEIFENGDFPLMENLPKLHLYLDQKALLKIDAKRNEAIKKGILQSSEDDWVKGKLTEDDSLSTDIKLRLKGDWTDHLEGDYWSYRIKMPSDKSWNRLQTFSLQDPGTRFYLHEWIYHKALEKVDVISPRYGFIEFSQNEKKPILYAYEEHFDKQVAEYKNRREGVIMKFSEDYIWNLRLRNKHDKVDDVHQNAIHNADILPFKQSKTFKNPKLTEQFERAQDLMNAFRNRTVDASEIFDMELMAKQYAITDIFNANHSMIWHNLRFYYNPITRKLEPIGFDGFTADGHFRLYSKLFFGEFKSSDEEDEWSSFYKFIFKNPTFIKHYIPALINYSKDEFINELFEENDEVLHDLKNLIKLHADPSYEFTQEEFTKRARKIHKNIQPFDENSLKVFREKDSNDASTLYASNYHNLPIVIIGSSSKKKWEETQGQSTLIRSNGRRQSPKYTEISVPLNHKYVFFKLPGGDNIYYSTIKNWSRPNQTPEIKYSASQKLSIPLSKEQYLLNGKQIHILSGKKELTEPMIIPEGYSLVLKAGLELDIKDKAYILSYGKFDSKGTKENPVIITSSDKSAQGFTIIKSPEKSILTYSTFINLNTLDQDEWQLTGAVTFYESPVEMTNVTITENLCEDALNIIRSKFSIQHLNINNTFADGFDGDFCKGKLVDSYFFNTGNDGLDFSGSVVDIDNVVLENIGDKGISAGEEANLRIDDVTIDGAQIGIASKDLSRVRVERTTIKNCNQGLAAYRKKPEFGGGRIDVVSFKEENVVRSFNADDESKIILPK